MAISEAFLTWERETRTASEQKGKQEGAAALVARQLMQKVGDLSDHTRSLIHTLSIEQLESLGEALLDFNTAEDLNSWLEGNS